MTKSFDVELCNEAGLTPSDIAPLLGVSRITVSRWFHDHTTPHYLLEDRVSAFMQKIKNALDCGNLPTLSTTKSSARKTYLHNILLGAE